MNATATYLKWRKVPSNGFTPVQWIGVTSTGKDVVAIEIRVRGSRMKKTRSAILTRLSNGSREWMSSVTAAKDYAQTLARLWNFPPYEGA